MLIDDGEEFNFLHNIILKHSNAAKEIVAMQTVDDAIDFLHLHKSDDNFLPDLIFLDINMPGKNGWDFLNEFEPIRNELSKLPVVIMLTSSVNPDDEVKALGYPFVSAYQNKPLVKPVVEDILKKYF
jgi:CheY-like chemotaxis protein